MSQTEGEAVSAGDQFLNLDLSEVLTKLTAFAGTQGFQIEYSDKIAPARGTSYRGLIRLMPEMEAEETVSVLIRELALQMLYGTQRRSFVTRDVLLRESKAAAFVVCNVGHRASRKHPALPQQFEPAGRELGSSAAHFLCNPWSTQPQLEAGLLPNM